MVAEINGRTLNDVPGFIDNEPKSRAFVGKGQPISPGVIVDAALTEARDLSLAHQNLNARRLNPQAFADDRRIDFEGVSSNSIVAIAKPRPRSSS